MGSRDSIYTRVYKFESSPVKDSTSAGSGSGWLGPLEFSVLHTLHRLGLRRFLVKDIVDSLKIDRRRAWDCLKRLVKRGLIRKLGRGLYEVVDSSLDSPIRELPSRVNSSSTTSSTSSQPRTPTSRAGSTSSTSTSSRSAAGSTSSRDVEFAGVFYDNVMWYDSYDRFRRIDRSTLLDYLPERVVYSELTALVRGLRVDGVIVIYSNPEDPQPSVRIEWRPPKKFVKKNDFTTIRRMFWEQLLVGFRALYVVLNDRKAPPWVRKRLAVLV